MAPWPGPYRLCCCAAVPGLGWVTHVLRAQGQRLAVGPRRCRPRGERVLAAQAERRKAATQFGGQVAEAIGAQLAGAAAIERRGLDELRKAVLPAPTQATIRQQVATCLARQAEPLLAAEIHDLVIRHLPKQSIVSIQDVRVVLQGGSEFVRAALPLAVRTRGSTRPS